jgi:serine phosphatase RsbU (regulator of sigma subunit)
MAGAGRPDDENARLREENDRLRRAVRELSILNDIATAINSTMPVDRILDLTLQKCLKAMDLEQGAVMLLNRPDTENPFQTMVRRGDSRVSTLPFRLDTQLSGWMIKHQKPLLINNFSQDSPLRVSPTEPVPIRSLLSVPLLVKGRMIGILSVFNKKQGGFTEDEQRLLAIIGSQAAQIIETARLLEEEKQLLLMQEDLRLAYEIQVGLLPASPPRILGYDIAGRSVPAKEVGGDYFDFIRLDDGRMGFCLGDITGKGLPAALLMANLQATVRGQALLSASARECVARANALLFQSTSPEKFATFCFGILDPPSGRFNYCNAGHNFPLLFGADGGIRRLGVGGLVLGAFETVPYDEETVSLAPGDLLVIFSDGLPEAMSRCGEEFGEEALVRLVESNRCQDAAGLVSTLLESIHAHLADCPQTDDMTLIVIKALPR